MRSSFSMSLLYHAYVYFGISLLACTIYILTPDDDSEYKWIYRKHKKDLVWMQYLHRMI